MTSQEKYALLDKLNLCHKCEKAKQWGGRKFCPECLEKIAEYNANHYNSQKAHDYQTRRKELYQEKKEKGICVRCSKKATHGLYCYECSIKAKKRSQINAQKRKLKRHERGIIPQIRLANGLCVKCGKPLDISGYKVCKKCLERLTEMSKLADKTKWREAERARYEEIRQKKRKAKE